VKAACSAAVATLIAAAPEGVVEAVAGLALLGTLGGALASALDDVREREGAVVTFLIAASGVSILGIGSAFWALVAGLIVRVAVSSRR